MGVGPISAARRRTPAVFDPTTLFGGSDDGAIIDASALSSLFQDSAGTTAVTATGDPIGKITDLSGKGRHVTQATSANRPVYRNVGGKKYIEFTTTALTLLFPSTMLSAGTTWSNGGTIVFSGDSDATPTGGIFNEFGTDGASDQYPWTASVYCDFLSTVRKQTVGNMTGIVNSWHQGDFRSASGSFSYSVNGTDHIAGVANTIGKGTAPKLGSGFVGKIGRLIVINRVLSGADLTNARAWCATGYVP